MKSFLLAAAAVLTLAAAPASADPVSDLVNKLFTATHNDFVAADVDAKAHGDAIASQCWEGADAYFTSQTDGGTGIVLPNAPVGVFSTFQAGRDVAKAALSAYQSYKANGKLPAALEVACGPLIVDVVDDLRTAGVGVSLGAFNVAVLGKPLF